MGRCPSYRSSSSPGRYTPHPPRLNLEVFEKMDGSLRHERANINDNRARSYDSQQGWTGRPPRPRTPALHQTIICLIPLWTECFSLLTRSSQNTDRLSDEPQHPDTIAAELAEWMHRVMPWKNAWLNLVLNQTTGWLERMAQSVKHHPFPLEWKYPTLLLLFGPSRRLPRRMQRRIRGRRPVIASRDRLCPRATIGLADMRWSI